MDTLILLLALVARAVAENAYQIPSYYGYWNLNFFNYENLTAGNLKYFQLHEAIDMDPDGNIYMADKDRHAIYKATDQGYQLVAGTSGRSGKRAGSAENSLWNGPTSLVYFSPNKTSEASQNSMNLYFVVNHTCSISDSDCIMSNPSASVLTLDNLAFDPPLVQFPQISQKQQYLYVSDTNNHCIKMIDLVENIVSIVAGKCGQPGFLDGPYEVNRLNQPKNLGVTRNREIYFFDSGNLYMRKLFNGSVYSLLNGGCVEYGPSRAIRDSYTLRNILCYNDWVEGETNNPESHYIDPETNVGMCTMIYPLCDSTSTE